MLDKIIEKYLYILFLILNMVYLRKVSLHDEDYYYLFYDVKGDNFKAFKRYIGKTVPSEKELEKLKKKFIEDIKKDPESFHKKDKNVIGLLQDIQEKKGFISHEDIVKISKNLDIPAVNLYGVLTFYSQFKLNKPGKYKISICRGTACHVKNSDVLLRSIEKILKIKPGETTKDEKFSLESVNCIGACAKAPAMMINEKVYGDLTEDKMKRIIDSLE